MAFHLSPWLPRNSNVMHVHDSAVILRIDFILWLYLPAFSVHYAYFHFYFLLILFYVLLLL